MNFYSNCTESELLNLLKQDDKQALTVLYYQNVQKLKYFIQKIAQSPFLTEDVIHDTFIRIWETRKMIDAERPFKPYLYTIAKRILLNLIKRAKHEEGIVAEMKKHSLAFEHTTDLTIDYRESNSLITEAVNALTGKPKEVFQMCRIDGLSYKQVAEALGITESTVNKHMSKAIALIKEYLKYKELLSLILAYISIRR